jgi:hypothetical protein
LLTYYGTARLSKEKNATYPKKYIPGMRTSFKDLSDMSRRSEYIMRYKMEEFKRDHENQKTKMANG